ncbi:MAG: dihydroxyacetone kinase subunit L [Methylophilales bacterium 28-44-11]|nr:MAG: dihydroxyacetone kinase subunit L [Methylophilales bacterium 28-44-11]
MQTSFILSASLAIHAAIVANEADIESLDRAIGDGDHYINMKRGSEAAASMYNELLALPADEALNKIGSKLLSTIGGAAGPLFASFCMGMAKIVKHNGGNTALEIAAAFAAGVQAIVQRGKAQVGEKTMLDVLVPVSTHFTLLAAEGKSNIEIARALKLTADQGLESTRNLIATKGRAAGLGERAIGHLDAGAKSCQVMVHTVCDLVIQGKNS